MLLQSLTEKVINAAMHVHSKLGAGLFEEVYKICLRHELCKIGLKTLSEVTVPIVYDGIKFESSFRIDLLIEDNLIVELKSVERICPVHKAQLLTYLKLTEIQVGLILNFNVPHLRDGIIRVVNSYPAPAHSSLK